MIQLVKYIKILRKNKKLGGNNLITQEKRQTIKLVVAIFILVIILAFVGIVMMKYEVEGETNMPFTLSKIVVVSSAEGQENEESDLKWDFSINQNNDVYFYIDQNTNREVEEDLLIKNVTISNIQITKSPQKGTIQTYMPNSEAGRLFTYDEQFLVQDSLTYKGASQSSTTNLEIGSKGGSIVVRFANTAIGNYSSDKDKQIAHDGTLLKKIEASKEEIQFSVSFDFLIETTQNKYQANISLDLPTGNLGEEENSYFEKTDMSDIIFKRVK